MSPAEALKLARRARASAEGASKTDSPAAAPAYRAGSPIAYRSAMARPCAAALPGSICHASAAAAAAACGVLPGSSCPACATCASCATSAASPLPGTASALRYAIPASASCCAFADPTLCGAAIPSLRQHIGGHFDRGVSASGCAMPRCMSVPAPLAASLSSPSCASPRRAAESDGGARGEEDELRGEHIKDRPERLTGRGASRSAPRPSRGQPPHPSLTPSLAPHASLPTRTAAPVSPAPPAPPLPRLPRLGSPDVPPGHRLTGRAASAISLASRRLLLQQQQQRANAGDAPAAAVAHAAWKAAALLVDPSVREATAAGAPPPSPLRGLRGGRRRWDMCGPRAVLRRGFWRPSLAAGGPLYPLPHRPPPPLAPTPPPLPPP